MLLVKIWLFLDQVYRSVTTIIEKHLAVATELNALDWAVISNLLATDRQRPTDLAKSVGRPSTSFTPTIDGLELKGYVKRVPDEGDRRAVRIVLTKEGRNLKNALRIAESAAAKEIREYYVTNGVLTQISKIADI